MMRDHRRDELAVVDQRLGAGRAEGYDSERQERYMKGDVEPLAGEYARHGRQHEDAHRCPHGDRHVEHVEVVPEVADAIDHGEHDDVHHDKAEGHVDPEHRVRPRLTRLRVLMRMIGHNRTITHS